MNDKHAQLRKDVLWEEGLVDEALENLNKVMASSDRRLREEMQKPAAGTYLMNFYNGVEGILKRISKIYYGTMPTGESWHRELLMQSCNPPEGKIPVLSEEIVARLHNYRGFRHVFVSGYGFKLDWQRLTKLIDDVVPLWTDIKRAIDSFFEKLG